MRFKFLCMLSLMTSLLFAESQCLEETSCVNVAGCSKVFSDNYVEARAGYFYFFDKDFREAYPGNGQFGAELTCQFYDMLYGWAQTTYFHTSSHLSGTGTYTSFTLVPCSFGLKYIYNRYSFQPYVGVGGLFTYAHQYIDSTILIRSQSKWCGGGHFKFGCLWKCTDSFLVDVFVDCYAQHVTMDMNKYRTVYNSQLNLSGLSAGAGLGYRF